MRGYSKVIIMGNLTRDPELKYLPSGTAVTSFTVAVSRNYVLQSGEQREETSFFSVIVWGKQAENCNQFLKKGSPVFVDGRLRQRSWEDKDGQRRSVVEIVGFTVQFLGGRPSPEQEFEEQEEIPLPEEELPF
ncbi:TPA: single-stranded DNA-binding protein [bacterium]|nr:single-stranded DNA-binding protein [bacterium]